MNLADLRAFTTRKWDDDLVPRLVDYVREPAKSPAFDASCAAPSRPTRPTRRG